MGPLHGVARRWHPELGTVAKVLPGFFYVTARDEYIETTLGSCVSACMRDPDAGVGRLDHIMLPLGEPGHNATWYVSSSSAANRFGKFALESLLNAILKAGGRRARLEVKLFGAGNVRNISSDVGARNGEFAQEYLRTEGVHVTVADVGDRFPRKLIYHPLSGTVSVKKLRRLYTSVVCEEERKYLDRLTVARVPGDAASF